MLDPAIVGFFAERRDAWLKSKLKASMNELEVKEKTAECEVRFSLDEWLPDAAKRAGQISLSSHPCTFSHPSARKNKNGYSSSVLAVSEQQNDGLLRSGNVDVAVDALGNAAALDVYKFLTLTMQDGCNLLTHLEQDSGLARSVMSIKSRSYEELKHGFLAMTQSTDGTITSSKIKQVYFPVKNNYHLLSVLTPSGIIFELRKRLDAMRFGDVVKQARETRRKVEYSERSHREITALTTIGYGGSKPQNISVLNNQNGGKVHLFSSLPPVLKKRDIQVPNSDFFGQTIRYFHCKDLYQGLHKLYLSDKNNMHVRAARDDFYQAIVDRIIEKMWQIRGVASDSFSANNSRLKHEQKIWLLNEYKPIREEESAWLDKLVGSITQFISIGYEKTLAKKSIKLGDDEYLHINEIVTTSREALR